MILLKGGQAELAGEISPGRFRSYLLRNGWRQTPVSRREVWQFHASEASGEDFEILVPAAENLTDYAAFATRVAKNLAAFEGRSLQDVVAQILFACDIFRMRLKSDEEQFGTIPLAKTPVAITNLAELLVDAACAEIRAVPHTPRRLKEAIELADEFRFGQTGIGSFVVNIYVPLPPKPADEMFEEVLSVPIQRSMLARVMRGLEDAGAAKRENDVSRITSNFATGLNANMCDSLSGLLETFSDATCEFVSNFDATWRSPGIEREKTVEITAAASRVLEQASLEMREGPSVREVSAFAWVYQLHHDAASGAEADRDAGFLWEEEGTLYRAKARLEPSEYVTACEAHKDERRVRFRGLLERFGRRWVLRNVRDLTIEEDDTQ